MSSEGFALVPNPPNLRDLRLGFTLRHSLLCAGQTGFAGAVEREALLLEVGRAEAHDWAGAYEDIHNYIGGHLPWPLQEAEQPGPEDGHPGRASQGDQPHQPTL